MAQRQCQHCVSNMSRRDNTVSTYIQPSDGTTSMSTQCLHTFNPVMAQRQCQHCVSNMSRRDNTVSTYIQPSDGTTSMSTLCQ